MYIQACLCAGKDLESSFHHCAGPVKLVQACLRARKNQQSCFQHCAGAVKLVQACLRAWKDRQSSFHRCLATSEARTISFKCGKGLTKTVSTAVEAL